jgi:sugar/nucleoside kinase (ribokinase family)
LSSVDHIPDKALLAVGYVGQTVWQDVLAVIAKRRVTGQPLSFVGYAPSGSMALIADTCIWLRDVLENFDAFVINQDELCWLAGQIGTSELALACNIGSRIILVVTDGGHTVVGFSKGTAASVPVTTIGDGNHDPIGAGDMFSGALFARLQMGLPVDVGISRASAMASAACTVSDPVGKNARGIGALASARR